MGATTTPNPQDRRQELEARRETYEGPTQLLEEIPIVGSWYLPEAIGGALRSDVHRNEFELHLVHEGCMEFWVDEPTNIYPVQGGMAILTRPGQVHGGTHEVLSPGRWSWIRWAWPRGDTAAMEGMSVRQTQALRRALSACSPPVFHFSPAMKFLFDQLIEEHRHCGEQAELVARSLLHQLIVQILRDYRAHGSRATWSRGRLTPPIAKVVQWMDSHDEQSLRVDQLASIAGLSPRYFRRVFQVETGFTPADFLLHRKVERAKRMLLNEPNTNVTQVAMRLGFSTSAYFTTVFRRKTGLTPTQFTTQHGQPQHE